MKLKIISIGAVMLVALLVSAWAADVTGKWVAQIPGRQGAPTDYTFIFKADGEKLTGTVTNPMGENPISEGKISGDQISFVVVLNFGGNEMKQLYKGTVSGDEIKFTRERQGGVPGGPGGPGGGQGGAPGGGVSGPPGGGQGGPPSGAAPGGGMGGRSGQPLEFVAKRVK